MYNLIWTYFQQNRFQWQQHMQEFVIILYCETANSSFGEDSSKVSTGRQQVVTGLTDVHFIATCHTSPTPYLEYCVQKSCILVKWNLSFICKNTLVLHFVWYLNSWHHIKLCINWMSIIVIVVSFCSSSMTQLSHYYEGQKLILLLMFSKSLLQIKFYVLYCDLTENTINPDSQSFHCTARGLELYPYTNGFQVVGIYSTLTMITWISKIKLHAFLFKDLLIYLSTTNKHLISVSVCNLFMYTHKEKEHRSPGSRHQKHLKARREYLERPCGPDSHCSCFLAVLPPHIHNLLHMGLGLTADLCWYIKMLTNGDQQKNLSTCIADSSLKLKDKLLQWEGAEEDGTGSGSEAQSTRDGELSDAGDMELGALRWCQLEGIWTQAR